MTDKRKQQIHALLKAIETGDSVAIEVVNEEKYIQHNPQTHEGSEGLGDLFKRLSKTSPKVNIVRLFADGDYVFAHTDYDFSSSNIGFEIFRFERDQAVEHWDNIQARLGPNMSGHSMVDGVTEITDLDRTETNRTVVNAFVGDVLLSRDFEKLSDYVAEKYIEHNPEMSDGLINLHARLSNGEIQIQYQNLHCLLAEGNFVLSVCEGSMNDSHTSFFDLYRLEDNKIIEHWDTTETVPPRSEWKNENGKFIGLPAITGS